MQARRNDEYLGNKYGLIGQETTGIGGLAKALRTIPQILTIVEEMRTSAPDAILLNFTNPSGLITQAVKMHAPEICIAGVCNGPYNSKVEIVELLNKHSNCQIDLHEVEVDLLGLNHLSWIRGFKNNGIEIWPEVLEIYSKYIPEDRWDNETLAILGMIPSNYLRYYYYTQRMLALQKSWPPSRAEEVMEVEKILLTYYSDSANVLPPESLMKRGGAFYSTVATELINAHYNDLGNNHIVNVCHNGAIASWPKEWVLEMQCKVDAQGFHPLSAEPLPPAFFGLLSAVKSYEILVAQAALTGDRQAICQALLVHPLGPDADKIPSLFDELVEINKKYIPQFRVGK